MGTILLTGFGAYANTPLNPAGVVADMLDGTKVAGHTIVSRILPAEYFGCIEAAKKSVSETGADCIIMMGDYPGRAMLTVERIAQNLNDCTRYGVKDNAGVALEGQLTNPDGPVAYWSTVPVRAMVKFMREAGVPADISDAPGTLCCNHLFYGMLDHAAQNKLPLRAGWIHLPTLPEVAARPENIGVPSMHAETAAKGVTAAIEAVIEHPEDIIETSPSRLQI
ncbi:pyroglutamyl-peptidase I [Roseibium sp. RKSG952]|uniref:pyroglutamyl-peptidase I n=1 Tax=Roseibium sp. RKSG952 TaxID=2529384 RepID=UPI0012BC8F1B|nr:pyroglutamyl-peptidase I [Roseibium sp. RKSG952]MTH98145.1 pyroglutamyl-peptidase I [Roseibium sp. RKSG952]